MRFKSNWLRYLLVLFGFCVFAFLILNSLSETLTSVIAARVDNEYPAKQYYAAVFYDVLTFGLLAFGTYQFLHSKGQSRQELRAYISIDTSKITVVYDTISKLLYVEIQSKIQNDGRTPAKKVQLKLSSSFCRDGVQPNFKLLNQTSHLMGSLGASNAIEEQKIRNQVMGYIVDYESRDDTLYLFGEIEYIDIFNEKHSTSFAYTINLTVQHRYVLHEGFCEFDKEKFKLLLEHNEIT